MNKYRIEFYKIVTKSDRRIAAAMEIEAYNLSCAQAIAAAITDNLPNNWYYEVYEHEGA